VGLLLDFILSKLNMLILVTALAAIVLFFSIGLGEEMVKAQAKRMTTEYVEIAFSLLNQQSLCSKKFVTIPSYLQYLVGCQTMNRLYYILDVSKVQAGPEQARNTLIFSIRSKREQKVLAAASVNTDADITLFFWDPKTGSLGEVDANTSLNPQSAPNGTNSMVLLKEVFLGKSYFFVIPCSADIPGGCEANYGLAVQQIRAKHGGGFGCEQE
jgi:hypothetical protein